MPCREVSLNCMLMSFGASPSIIFHVWIMIYRSLRLGNERRSSFSNGRSQAVISILAAIDSTSVVSLDAFNSIYITDFVRVAHREAVFEFAPYHGFVKGEHEEG